MNSRPQYAINNDLTVAYIKMCYNNNIFISNILVIFDQEFDLTHRLFRIFRSSWYTIDI